MILNYPNRSYKGLRVRDILNFAKAQVHKLKYLSDYEFNKELNLSWFWNLMSSLISYEFKAFITSKVKQTKKDLVKSENLCVTGKH